MVLQSLSDCIYKRSQVKEAVPETAFVYQYSFWLTALILVLLFETFPATWTAWKSRRRGPGGEARPEKTGGGLAPALIAFGCLVSWYSFISWPRSRAYRTPR